MRVGGAPRTDWAAKLAISAVAVEFCVSANLLTWMGVPYVTEGGALPLKIHPGTYMLAAAFGIHIGSQSRPNGLFGAVSGDRLLAVYLGSMVASLVYALALTGKGNLIVLIDTFLPAGLLAAVLQTASARDLKMLRRVFQWGCACNALLALGEAAEHVSLVPFYLNDAAYHARVEEFRPTGLYDHPLTGGAMTMMGLALAPAGLWVPLAYIGLLACAMLAFGGRVAVAVTVLGAIILLGRELCLRVLRRDRYAINLLVTSFCVLMLAALAALAVCSAGLGQRLTGHLYWDPSAQVRLAQWHLIGELDGWQVLFGARRDDLLAMLNPLWLTYGVEVIENFWLLMFASLGASGFSIFVSGFVALLFWCWQNTNLRGRAILLGVLLVASASNSLGRKSTVLVGLVGATISAAALPGGGLVRRRPPSEGVRPLAMGWE